MNIGSVKCVRCGAGFEADGRKSDCTCPVCATAQSCVGCVQCGTAWLVPLVTLSKDTTCPACNCSHPIQSLLRLPIAVSTRTAVSYPADTYHPMQAVRPVLPLPQGYPSAPATASRRQLTQTHWILLGLGAIAVIAVTALFALVSGSSRHSPDIAEMPQNNTALHESNGRQSPGGEQYPAPAVSNAITFDDMRTFVMNHYADLPANPSATWSRLDPHFTAEFSWNDYVDFWSSIASVHVDSVRPRDSDSVIARLTYVRRNGSTDTEDRWLSFVSDKGKLALFDSERMGSVS